MKGGYETAMNEANKRELIKEYTDNYLGKIFYYCLKKTGDSYEAEDLASDITLNVLKSLESGSSPESFSSWTWKIARNRYARWADRKRIKNESVSGADIFDYEIADDEEIFLDTWIKNEELAILRRELAFISSDYRNIIVAFYLDDRKIKDIATGLRLPENTVKTKLMRGRQILKEGMNMAREFGTRSYKPENVEFINWCSRFGDRGQPWSVLEHPMYKNIFLEAYGEAKTAEELSLELGIALPYMESELEFLTNQTFLIKEKNKYITSFPIISKEAQMETDKLYNEGAKAVYPMITRIVDIVDNRCKEEEYSYYGSYQSYEEAKWTLLMLAFEPFLHLNGNKRFEYPNRPDNGCWEIIGYQSYEHNEPEFVGSHYDDTIGFSSFRFNYKGISQKTHGGLSIDKINALRSLVRGENNVDEVLCEELVKGGFVHKKDGKYIPEVVAFDKEYKKKIATMLTADEKKEIEKIKEEAKTVLSEVAKKARNIYLNDLPAYYRSIDRLANFVALNGGVDRDRIFTLAIESGYLKYDDSMVKALGTYVIK